MKNNLRNAFRILAFLPLVSGCATILSGTSQNINVKVVDTDNNLINSVTCQIIDGNGGETTLTTNPGMIKVRRSTGGLNVICRKEGFRQLNTAVGDDFNAVAIANVLFWPGIFVDLATGSYKKYPSHYVVTMEKANYLNK